MYPDGQLTGNDSKNGDSGDALRRLSNLLIALKVRDLVY
jgi:hypothetical protein